METNNTNLNNVIDSIKTLDDLCRYINASDDYDNRLIDAVIEKNGWVDMQGENFGICRDNNHVAEFGEKGAYVREWANED